MANPLWDFSLKFYDDPEVQAACLVLQDEAGCDVNLLLFALFHAHGGRTLTPETFAALDARVGPIRDLAVAPLRAIRRKMKLEGYGADPESFERLRTEVKTVELHAEKLMQSVLAEARPPTGPAAPDVAARLNLAAYAEVIGADLPEREVAVLTARLARMS